MENQPFLQARGESFAAFALFFFRCSLALDCGFSADMVRLGGAPQQSVCPQPWMRRWHWLPAWHAPGWPVEAGGWLCSIGDLFQKEPWHTTPGSDLLVGVLALGEYDCQTHPKMPPLRRVLDTVLSLSQNLRSNLHFEPEFPPIVFFREHWKRRKYVHDKFSDHVICCVGSPCSLHRMSCYNPAPLQQKILLSLNSLVPAARAAYPLPAATEIRRSNDVLRSHALWS